MPFFLKIKKFLRFIIQIRRLGGEIQKPLPPIRQLYLISILSYHISRNWSRRFICKNDRNS